MNILWLSWRDIKNPNFGGAEKVAFETASRFVKRGDKVTIFTSSFPHAKVNENIDGLKIIRRGNQISCRLHAFLYYLKKSKDFDVIIDEINTIPFFSVLYAKPKTVALIHQLAKEYWFKETFFPISIIGYLLEPLWLKLYSNRPTIALSESTKTDLVNLGFKKIKTYRPGLDIIPEFKTEEKESLVLFVGRLTKAKNPRDAIIAFGEILRKVPKSQLIIIGKGNPKYEQKLKNLVKIAHLENSVRFTGYIDNIEKIQLLKRAKIVLIPSVREGWNLVATEANATGCVPIGYNVPGLRDSILNQKTGVLVAKKSPEKLAQAALAVLSDENLYQSLAKNGLAWSKKFNWDKTFSSFKEIIKLNPKNILWLSWRDIKNPSAGGAEKVAIETSKRFVKGNFKVTIFTSSFKGAKPDEIVSGVKIIRRGNLLTCRLYALLYFLKHRDFDVIIDEINTIPFFSLFYTRGKTVALIHQLARQYWWSETFFPLNLIGYILEPLYLKLYRKTKTMAVSKSTYDDLKNLGFDKVSIIREGLDFRPKINQKKTNLILFIGRLTKSKGPQDAILAFKKIGSSPPFPSLSIIGKGEPKFVNKLKLIARKLNLGSKVKFEGFISDQKKLSLLTKSKIVLIPSVREGWNLVATEASACGTVPVAYNVAGLKDSVRSNQTGILTDPNPSALAAAALKVLSDENLRSQLVQNGYKFTRKFSWDNTFRDVRKIIFPKSN